jgi:glycosyltransferase involved in cell wall biosynthesis
MSVGFPLARLSPQAAGGAEQVLLRLDRGLVSHGHRSIVLAPHGSRCHGLLIPAQVPDGSLDERVKREARRSFKRALEQALARFSTDLVHMHGFDFDHYLPEQSDVPVVVSLHLPLSWYTEQALKPARPNTSLVCVSKTQRASAAPDVRIAAVVPNGVDVEDFRSSRRKGKYALILGRICPEKAPHLAIDAARRAHIEVFLAGTVFDYPEHRHYFEAMIRPRLGGNAWFIGPVGGGAKTQLLGGAKCLLIPSQAPETSSLVAMEAIAAGTPVIAWRSGALPEIVADGRTGFLVSSVEEMANAIRRAAIIPPEACRREAQQRFDSQQMISHYLGLYRSLAGEANAQELAAA